jgi:hypothetical protein
MDLLLISVEPHLSERAAALVLVALNGGLIVRRWPRTIWAIIPCLAWSAWFLGAGVVALLPSLSNAHTRAFIVPQLAIAALVAVCSLGFLAFA